jgi:hypothetical protein
VITPSMSKTTASKPSIELDSDWTRHLADLPSRGPASTSSESPRSTRDCLQDTRRALDVHSDRVPSPMIGDAA